MVKQRVITMPTSCGPQDPELRDDATPDPASFDVSPLVISASIISINPAVADRLQFWFRGSMPSFICPIQTCAKTYTTENRLQKHYQKKHDIRLPDDARTTSVVASKNGVKRKECGDEVRREKK